MTTRRRGGIGGLWWTTPIPARSRLSAAAPSSHGIDAAEREASLGRAERRREHAHERRLARARRADHRGALARAEPERHAAQRAVAVRMDEGGAVEADAERRRAHYLSSPAERAAASIPS